MFSVITHIYNKKAKDPTLMEMFTATGKLIFFLTNTDVRCVHHWWHGTQRYDIQVLAIHASTWVHRYSSLLQRSVTLGQRGQVAVVGRILCTKCTLHSKHRLTVWYSNTQNDFSPGAAIFSLHTLASPSGRNVNYDEKQLTGGRTFLNCSFCIYRFRKYVSYGFPIINFCNPGLNYETSCIRFTLRLDKARQRRDSFIVLRSCAALRHQNGVSDNSWPTLLSHLDSHPFFRLKVTTEYNNSPLIIFTTRLQCHDTSQRTTKPHFIFQRSFERELRSYAILLAKTVPSNSRLERMTLKKRINST